MVNPLLAARLGVAQLAPKTKAPVAAPVVPAGNHPPAPAAAEGVISLDQHHKKFVAAHKAGKHAEAKTHALNYANAASKLGKADSQPPNPPTSGGGMAQPNGMLRDMLAKKGF